MTKAEYEAKYSKVKNTTLTGGFSAHKSAVETAINQGKPVPAEVLKDYPELKGNENTMDMTTSKERAEMGRNAYGFKENSDGDYKYRGEVVTVKKSLVGGQHKYIWAGKEYNTPQDAHKAIDEKLGWGGY